MLLQRELVLRFIKYNVVGCFGIVIYFLSVYVLIEKYHWNPIVGSMTAFIMMTIVSLLLNVRYTFESRFTHQKVFRFLIVSFIGFVLNFMVMFLIIHILTYHYLIGELITILVIPMVNFILNNYWTFQAK